MDAAPPAAARPHVHAHTEIEHGSPAALAALSELVGEWWAQRCELRPGGAWEVPFPARPGEGARVLRQPADRERGEREVWRAALVRAGARTAYIEVHSDDGPVAALISLYQHVV